MTDAIFYSSYPDTYKYIYIENQSICLRTKPHGCHAYSTVLCSDCSGHFCAWYEHSAILIIYYSNDSKVKYIRIDGKDISNYTLNPVKEGIMLSSFGISSGGNGESLFYSAEISDRIYLLRCRLDNNDPVENISELGCCNFYTDDDFIYYTAYDDTLVMLSLNENSAPAKILCSGGSMCHGITSDGERLHTYIKSGAVYFGNERICDDSAAENPIIVKERDKLMLQWKSSSKLCYSISYNNGKTWSGARKIIYSSAEPTMFYVFTASGRHVVYGVRKKHEIALFERTDKSWCELHKQLLNDKNPMIRKRLEKIEHELNELKNML